VCLYYADSFIIVFSQTIYQSTNRAAIFVNVFDWVACKLVTQPKAYFYDPYHNITEPASSFDNCGDVPQRPPAFGLYVALHLAISLQGVFMFLNYVSGHCVLSVGASHPN
jgi:hypothetical protein